MISFLIQKILNCKYDFKQEDIIPEHVYKSLNFDCSVIGGSYALKRFTGDKWKSKDIDVFVSKCDDDAFKKYIEDFMRKTDAKITHADTYSTEFFNLNIRQVYTFKVPEMTVPIQFIHMVSKEKENIVSTYSRTVDLPSAVCYTIENGEKIYHIPERALSSIFTRNVNLSDCGTHDRHKKYKSRGYYFS